MMVRQPQVLGFKNVTNIYSKATGNFSVAGDAGDVGTSNMIATQDNIQNVFIQSAGGNGIEINKQSSIV